MKRPASQMDLCQPASVADAQQADSVILSSMAGIVDCVILSSRTPLRTHQWSENWREITFSDDRKMWFYMRPLTGELWHFVRYCGGSNTGLSLFDVYTRSFAGDGTQKLVLIFKAMIPDGQDPPL